MRHLKSTYLIILVACMNIGCVFSQVRIVEMPDVIAYDPGSFLADFPKNYPDPYFSYHSLTNSDVRIYGRFPWIGYPSRPAILPGLNDTLQFAVLLSNRTDKPYLLSDKNVEEWFVPQVFGIEQDIHNDIPVKDENSLKFKFREIQGNPDTLAANSWDVSLVYDVWNLPPGTFRLVAKATDNIPKEFIGRTTGEVYMMKEKGDLADSTNVLESFYLRYKRRGDWEAAKAVTDSILSLNKHSIVGWGLIKDWCWAQNKLECAIAALDSAIKYLENDSDPAAPTKQDRESDPEAAGWYDHYLNTFRWERDFLKQ
ncbi:hypothetical protein KKH18_13535 [bacterium]|nr:hypothetical protein [bacterium]